MKVVAVIPCYNEAEHIGDVVTRSLKYCDEVVVSDGNSTDETMQVAAAAGATILPAMYPEMGYGLGIRCGINHVLAYKNADIVVMLDGDGQHDPDDIPAMIAPIIEDKADIVMGSRLAKSNMPSYRRFGNKVLTTICNYGAEFQPEDSLTGFWALRESSIPILTERTWGMAVELLIKSRAAGKRIVEVPINCIYHDKYSDNSTVQPVNLGLNLIWYILKWRIRCKG